MVEMLMGLWPAGITPDKVDEHRLVTMVNVTGFEHGDAHPNDDDQ